jgi:hypothetical protein
VTKVKNECQGATWGLVFKLEQWFLEHQVMIALGVIHNYRLEILLKHKKISL